TAKPGSEPVKKFTRTAAIRNIGGHEAWTFNGTVPGPELRVKTGDRVIVTLVNHLPGATSIHWHGIIVPNAMDGVAGITQDAVKPGGTFTYEFVANEAGTYWYHSHQDTTARRRSNWARNAYNLGWASARTWSSRCPTRVRYDSSD